ncbi:hypothetical protein UFOVP609_31 [uncultured Caudovirales phage]|uniref:Uncharacterized protein n=1 Tax=uncultured Caudovirales phage TaxID=2100421 RepID=A0A6J5N2F2_9CAUD|nr:hypothetical protein UFOVP609_31 [uncultured Caudovirales phage]
MHQIKEIMDTVKVSEEEAKAIYYVVENEALLDWSEATARQYKQAFQFAQQFIANGNSWE